jgi:hypothetical protein
MSSHLSDSRREKTLTQLHEVSKAQLWYVETIAKRMGDVTNDLRQHSQQLKTVIDLLTKIVPNMGRNV